MSFLFYFFVFLFGLCVGSFLNVVIFRLETGESVVKKSSHCPNCGKILRWYDMIPVLSFFILRGRCRDCGKKISWQYPVVELITGSLFLLIFWNLNFEIWDLFQILIFGFWIFIASCLIVIFVYDLRYYIIPDKIVYPAIVVVLISRIFSAFVVFNLPAPLVKGGVGGLIGNFLPFLFSAFGAAVFFLAIVLITKGKGMGIGDIKLAFLMGLILGWPNILAALFLAFFAGAVVGIILILVGRKTLKSQIPFGPFLVGGTIFVLLFGSQISSLYFKLFF